MLRAFDPRLSRSAKVSTVAVSLLVCTVALAASGKLKPRASTSRTISTSSYAPSPIDTTTPAPSPAPAPVPSVPTAGLDPIASNFDTSPYLVASGGTGAIPPSGAPDEVGAFRMDCEAGQLLKDDPIVYPGQPGQSHLHQFFGNLSANANSTFASLRTTGESSCYNKLNRSAYWMPAMLDGVGNVVRPDYVAIYYKRRPSTDPECQHQGIACVDLPRGLRFIMGYNMLTMTGVPNNISAWFNCQGEGAVSGHYATIPDAMANCPVGDQLGAVIVAPDCWDGVNLDSADHRSHLAYGSYGDWGYYKCDAGHPYVIPTFTLGAWYTTDANKGTWHLSSDEMVSGAVAGTTFHADYFEGWDDDTRLKWEQNCIQKLLNCSGGNLGNGQQLAHSAGIQTFRANPRLVPVP